MTKLLNTIQILKSGGIVRDYNHSPQIAKLSAVRGVTLTYHLDHMEYTYSSPAIVDVTPVAELAIVPAVEVDQPSDLMIPCALRLNGEKFTQDNYLKIANIFTASGTQYYVLAHATLGGKLYRKPEDVRFVPSVDVAQVKKAS